MCRKVEVISVQPCDRGIVGECGPPTPVIENKIQEKFDIPLAVVVVAISKDFPVAVKQGTGGGVVVHGRIIREKLDDVAVKFVGNIVFEQIAVLFVGGAFKNPGAEQAILFAIQPVLNRTSRK